MAELGSLYRLRRPRAGPRGPAPVPRRLLPHLIVYVVPLASFAALGVVSALLDTHRVGPSVRTFLSVLLAPAIEALRDLGAYVALVLHLVLIAAYAVKPHPLTGALSVLAVAAWLLYGLVLVSLGRF